MAYFYSQALKASDHNTAGGRDPQFASPTQYQGGVLRIAGGHWDNITGGADVGDAFLACRLLATDRIWALVVTGGGEESAGPPPYTYDIPVYSVDSDGQPVALHATEADIGVDRRPGITDPTTGNHQLRPEDTGLTIPEMIQQRDAGYSCSSSQHFYIGFRLDEAIDVDPSTFGMYVEYTRQID